MSLVRGLLAVGLVVLALLVVHCCFLCRADSSTGIYTVSSPYLESWSNSERCCQFSGMQLAKMDTFARFSNARDFMYSYFSSHTYMSILWMGLHATNVSDLSTYTWSDGNPFNLSAWEGRVPLDFSEVGEEEEACFVLHTTGYKYDHLNSAQAFLCDKKFTAICEVVDGVRRQGAPPYPHCMLYQNFVRTPTPPGGLAASADTDAVTLAGRFVQGWNDMHVLKQAPRNTLAAEELDCFLFCLQFNETQGIRLNYILSQHLASTWEACSCLIYP